MAVLEYMMNTDTVSSKGKQLEDLGVQLQQLQSKCDTTIETLATQGMLGKVKTKMSTVYETVQPSMSKQMDRIDALGAAVQKSAANTNTMAENVANSLTSGTANA